MVNMKIVDLQITIHGLQLKNDESIDDFVTKIEKLANSNYIYSLVLYEEEI